MIQGQVKPYNPALISDKKAVNKIIQFNLQHNNHSFKYVANTSVVTMTLLSMCVSQLTTILGVFVRVILAVVITVTHPALWYTVTCVTLEATGLTCMVAH